MTDKTTYRVRLGSDIHKLRYRLQKLYLSVDRMTCRPIDQPTKGQSRSLKQKSMYLYLRNLLVVFVDFVSESRSALTTVHLFFVFCHLLQFALVTNGQNSICPCLLWYQIFNILFVPVCFVTKWSTFHLSPFALVPNGKISFDPICFDIRANGRK